MGKSRHHIDCRMLSAEGERREGNPFRFKRIQSGRDRIHDPRLELLPLLLVGRETAYDHKPESPYVIAEPFPHSLD